MRFILKVLPFLYMGFIWFLSGRPADAVIRFSYYDGLIKESLHLMEFAILYVLLVLALLSSGKLTRKTNWGAAIVACLYGLLDEIHQSFIPHRSATVIDLVKDVTGVSVCFLLVYRGYLLRKNRLGKWLRGLECRLAGEQKKLDF